MASTTTLVRPIYLAVYAKLQTVTVDGQPIRLAEGHAPNAAYPYVTWRVSMFEHGEQRGNGELEVHVWGNDGDDQVLLILDAIQTALDRVALLNTNAGKVISLPGPTPPIGREGNGATRHGIQQFWLKVQKPL